MAEYAWYEFVRDWPELTVAINELEIRLRRDGRLVAADMLLRAFGTLRVELVELSRTSALFATEELRRKERQTRVRPDTLGGGGARLEDSLEANPVGQHLLPGSIGVANEKLLDDNVPWWITNEIGSTARVGGRIFGYFYGAGSAGPPDEDEGANRVHPLFQPDSGISPLAGPGTIREPIPARYFIAKAVPLIDRYWKDGFRSAKTKFDDQLTRVLGTQH